MTRRKTKLTFIANDTERKTSYKKRKKSLLKKTEELSTLCGIEACAIVYGPDDPQPETWPSEAGVKNVLGKFSTIPEWEQGKKMANQESFIAESIQKGRDKVKKIGKDNKEKEMTMFMYQCFNTGTVHPDNNMAIADLNVLSSVIEQKLRDISRRMETLNVNETTPQQPEMQTPALPVAPEETTTTPLNYGPDESDVNADPLESQWFMDLLNGNGDETPMTPFGDVNLPL
ncbi:hypothetical protein AAZX31_18G052600 [Glycine max]|uniref:MADS-box domain-containing protein n=1 Tax=Glycine max TaxID=3847 RepID=K7MQ39_SOYBN|nr:agamous-like MADS-box protein AGL80 [Glycine max]KRG98148.1 hypothetical protein GLYMA_18G053400v4 [Glycine max]|eukprot:XP_003552918.1 agamous-like MADS-box protein AGL80 [Glycine max]